MEAQLDRAQACVTEHRAAAHALVRVDELAARGVREDAVALPAEKPPDRLVASAAEQIPDRDLDDPVAAVVEVDRLEDRVNGLGVGRVASDEQALEQRAIGHRVAARVALDAVVGADDHDRRLLGGARLGIPCGAERRVERIAVDPRLDRCDPHQSPL